MIVLCFEQLHQGVQLYTEQKHETDIPHYKLVNSDHICTDPHNGKACGIYIIAISRQQPVTRTPAHEYVGLQAMTSLYLAQVRTHRYSLLIAAH